MNLFDDGFASVVDVDALLRWLTVELPAVKVVPCAVVKVFKVLRVLKVLKVVGAISVKVQSELLDTVHGVARCDAVLQFEVGTASSDGDG